MGEAANDNVAQDWCRAKPMAKRIGIGESTFRTLVRQGTLPAGHRLGGAVLYNVADTLAAIDGKRTATGAVAANDNVDPIMAGIIAYGAQERERRRATSARS